MLCVPCLVYSQLRLHQWNNSYYNKYNYSTFQNLSIIHKEIDLKNIDYELFSAAIFYATNIERVKYGRNVFRHSLSLEKAAQGHSKVGNTQTLTQVQLMVKDLCLIDLEL